MRFVLQHVEFDGPPAMRIGFYYIEAAFIFGVASLDEDRHIHCVDIEDERHGSPEFFGTGLEMAVAHGANEVCKPGSGRRRIGIHIFAA